MSDPSAQHPQQPSSWQTTTTGSQGGPQAQANNFAAANTQGYYYPYYWPTQQSQQYRTSYPLTGTHAPFSPQAYAATSTSSLGHAPSSVSAFTTTPGLSGAPGPTGPVEPWDRIIREFLNALGLSQALAGFKADLLIMNEGWENEKVSGAATVMIQKLQSSLQAGKLVGSKKQQSENSGAANAGEEAHIATLDERKLECAHYAEGAIPRTPTQINKEISLFLARNRARNDASNRAEFLRSLAEKRAALPSSSEQSSSNTTIASCARVDAKTIDRDVQMKYDIAKNEEGPLRKTIAPTVQGIKDKGKRKAVDDDNTDVQDGSPQEAIVTAATHPAFDERLQNIEKHFSVRYVPSPPLALLDRLKLLEEHIIRLEKDYPPWAALHFNQPNRGWPPPPRSTPIIVPSNVKRLPKAITTSTTEAQTATAAPVEDPGRQGSPDALPPATKKSKKSSLHRAVTEKLEVKQAMEDLAGGRGRTT